MGESILGRESTDVIFCFHFLSFCFHVLSCSVAMYQRYRSSKADMLKPVRWISAQTLAFFEYTYGYRMLSFLLSFSYRFGGLCRLPSSGFMNMYMYKLVIVFSFYRFLGGNALAVLRCKPKWNAGVTILSESVRWEDFPVELPDCPGPPRTSISILGAAMSISFRSRGSRPYICSSLEQLPSNGYCTINH